MPGKHKLTGFLLIIIPHCHYNEQWGTIWEGRKNPQKVKARERTVGKPGLGKSLIHTRRANSLNNGNKRSDMIFANLLSKLYYKHTMLRFLDVLRFLSIRVKLKYDSTTPWTIG